MNMRKGACIICGLALTGVLATGCMPASSQTGASAAASATPASAYIASVHQAFSTIDVQMEDVKKAAAAADATAVYAALDKVDAQVAEIEKLTVPEGLEEVQAKYAGASKNLAETLRAYAAYRLDGGANASNAATKLAAIQADYKEGIEALRAADEIAKGL